MNQDKEKEMKLFPADQSDIDDMNLFDVLDKVDDIDSD